MIERLLPAGPQHRVRVRCTARVDGDFHVDAPREELAARRRAVAPGEWTWLHQVHGSVVVPVHAPGGSAGTRADGSITDQLGAVLAIQTADCAPVVLAGDGVVAAVHAGWRGVVEGVIPNAIGALRAHAPGEIHAFLGPCIAAAAYAFGDDDLSSVVEAVGPAARGCTDDCGPALDLAAAVRAQCLAHGVTSFEQLATDDGSGVDTSDPAWFSHRTRADPERQVTVAWIEHR